MAWVFLISLGLLVYMFAGYPWLLRLIIWFRGPRPVVKAPIEPPVTLVISAFNEAPVIRRKLENALSLDYPADRFSVAVVSDASDDGTDDIVREFAGRGVTLYRQQQRRGKTAGLNAVLPFLESDIIVFSDANAMYELSAIRALVQNFADSGVGCVIGEARYLKEGATAADEGERTYWNYEIQVKRLETAVGSVVGGDGAIYAIRRELWRTLPENAINDFLNPLQIVAAGWRGVYEPEAICWEETAGGTVREYRRRVRIVSRSWRAVFQAPGVLNPFRVGFFAVSLLSHKLLRWFSGVIVLTALASGGRALVASQGARLGVFAALAAVALVLVGVLPAGRRLVRLGSYFGVINAASLVGLVKGTAGYVSGTWATPRVDTSKATTTVALRTAVVLTALAGLAGLTTTWFVRDSVTTLTWTFWGSLGLLGYVYVAYPAVLAIWRRLAARPPHSADVTPRVCLFITAYNEAEVIADKLRNALELDYPREQLDVVVASDGSTDGTNGLVQHFAARGVTLLPFPVRRGKIGAIISGIASVDADIVVFSDANTLLRPDALRALVRPFADVAVGGVSGDVVLVGERAALAAPEDLYYSYERWLQQVESDIGTMIGADGALYAIRRELFAAPPPDTILDDMAIPFGVCRAGFRVVFEPRALAIEQGSLSAWEEFSRKSRVVAGAVQLVERSGKMLAWGNPQFLFAFLSHKVLRWLSPVFALAAAMCAVGLATRQAVYVAAAAVVGIVLMMGLAGCSRVLRRWRPVAMAHYLCLVMAAAIVGLLRGLLARQPVKWRRFGRHALVRRESGLTTEVTR